ncbi:Spo0E family sporulation regulatory protein-aspartic acid phosphatase [Domibacillus sp.]|uniref:Spo0E family sporulation regulatory protein-aspartic acid phosphatase n=1 Tax=Domibacillus sp. TaxID=1969783 RepID=UPI0035C6675D
MSKDKESIDYLLLEIERVRELLNNAIRSYGLSSEEALFCSEELNKLIIHVQLHNRKVSCYT